MTESGKQKLRLFYVFLLFVGVFFWLEGQGAPGWKTGIAMLPMTVITSIELYLERNTLYRLPYIVFCAFFWFFTIKNFLAH